MILAIDTSTARSVIALKDKGEVNARYFEPRATQRVIFGELSSLLNPDTIAMLEGIIVGLGPGSFTGVKIGVTAAKTLAWSREIPIVGVCSLDAIAATVAEPDSHDTGLIAAVPSTRGEAYIRQYKFVDGFWVSSGVVADVRVDSNAADLMNEAEKYLIAGEASDRIYDAVKDIIDCKPAGEENKFPLSEGLFAIGENRLDSGDVDIASTLVPLYIRASQAERKLGIGGDVST